MNRSISFAIMTHNEIDEFDRLMRSISPFIRDIDEVVVLDDFSCDSMIDCIKKWNVKFQQRALKGDFAGQRNFLAQMCKSDYIFMIDADEVPAPGLLNILTDLSNYMCKNSIDSIEICRLNLIYQDSILDYDKYHSTASNIIPSDDTDPQFRIYLRTRNIKWKFSVHEKLYGAKTYSSLPAYKNFSLLHFKTSEKQASQIQYYDEISNFRNSDTKKRFGIFLKKVGIKAALRRLSGPKYVPLDPNILSF